ncbi:abortive infection system antitoxin AbiGi family protein [Vibrio alginolyticus]|uniref:abortive infection system antitoxin AbiGi family protein n=1 Tax=Vibrio alginolyticus TaxID=663 RepID=UPI003D7D3534
MKPKSDNLFHFTSSLDVLKLILKNGVHPRYCLEDFGWFGSEKFKHVAYPMSCFCDIPLSRISDHTDFYGMYGIGFTKEWGLKNGLNPVIYLTEGGSVCEMVKFYFNLPTPEKLDESEVHGHLYTLLSHIKPINGTMYIGGKSVGKDFYQENEWRYVPKVDNVIYAENFEEERDESNKELEKYRLQFTPQDIKYVFVKSDSDIPGLVDYINVTLGSFPHNDLKILQSRIISLETLRLDI